MSLMAEPSDCTKTRLRPAHPWWVRLFLYLGLKGKQLNTASSYSPLPETKRNVGAFLWYTKDAHVRTVIVPGNWHGEQNSNLGFLCLTFVSIPLRKARIHLFFQLFVYRRAGRVISRFYSYWSKKQTLNSS